jgi:hypothetical protein
MATARSEPGLHRPGARPAATLLAFRVTAALLLLFVGADHYYEYSHRDYSVIPTIGTLFLLDFLAATVLGLLLLAPLRRLPRALGTPALALVAAGGALLAGSSLLALLVSEQTKLFGFMEQNYRPEIVVAIASEAAAAVALGVLAAMLVRRSRGGFRGPAERAAPGR